MSKTKLIFALDVSSKQEALELIDELRDEVGAFKIGLQLFTSEGASFVGQLVESGLRLFLDVKFHDIPNTVAAAAVEVAKLGVWMFNIHAAGGPEMMKRTVGDVNSYCAKAGAPVPKILAVTVLTSIDGNMLKAAGVALEPRDLVVKYAMSASSCGLDGVIASPLETGMIRERLDGKEFLIVTPGVRPAFATNDDQKRVTTPKSAVMGGADFIVVGRPIRMAEDRADAARRIAREMTELSNSI
ncbi:MAG: orotidine-5'-phosphate decarboxylase [Acidobacteriota bacterium]|nr:orotidine-5'-phosphate decarboxylase [Acidobacteriota bacterium]MDH3529899.1 orotidine-5'-phosphate decarboxylase [Acidobacteriota bacterium]